MATSLSVTFARMKRYLGRFMSEAQWRRRYRAVRLSLPRWARDAPDRLLYAPNQPGRSELSAWDRRTTRRRQVTAPPEGPTRGTPAPPVSGAWCFHHDGAAE